MKFNVHTSLGVVEVSGVKNPEQARAAVRKMRPGCYITKVKLVAGERAKIQDNAEKQLTDSEAS